MPRDPWALVPPAGYRCRDPIAVARDPATPWAELVRAALVAPELVARNPALHGDWQANRHVLDEPLPDDVFTLGLVRLVERPSAPSDLVERLLRSGLPAACANAWSNPGLTDQTVAAAAVWWAERIFEGSSRRVDTTLEVARVLVLSHPRTPARVFGPLADGASWSSLVAAATVPRRDGGAAARIHAHLARAGTPRPPTWVRAFLAGHGSWSPGDLRRAARDRSPTVRARVASRPGLPDDLIVRFLRDRDARVRAGLAGRSDLPPLVAACLAVDPVPGVRDRLLASGWLDGANVALPVGRRPLPARTAVRRARDRDATTREAVLTDPRVALTTLGRWAWQLHHWRRAADAEAAMPYPNTSGENQLAIALHQRLLTRSWGATRVVGRRDDDETLVVRPFDPPRAVGGWEGYVWVDLPDDAEDGRAAA